MICSAMNDDQRPKTNHGVVVVGYKLDSTLDPDCKGYFIIKNSYGTSWGENGYAKFCMYKDETKYPYGMCNMYYRVQIAQVGLLPNV